MIHAVVLLFVLVLLMPYAAWIPMPVIAAVLFMGIGEAALFSGGVGIYIFAGNFLLSANAATEEVRGVVL